MTEPAKPYPKAAQLARGERRYRRKIASPKQWQAIVAAKIGPCRVCGQAAYNGGTFPKVHLHHIVARQDHGDDVPANIVPLCLDCHDKVTRRAPLESTIMLRTLTAEEWAYMVARGGPDYPQRGYSVVYSR